MRAGWVSAAVTALLLGFPGTAWGAPATVPPPEPTAPPSTAAPVPPSLPPAQGPLIVVPTGCALPVPATAVFEGEIEVLSLTAARFRVLRELAGTLEGHFVAPATVDVVYGTDARFLVEGERYLVGALADPAVGGLRSTVRQPAPLFGGDAVIGLDDTDVDCPVVEDPVRTLLADGTSVDSGVLTTMEGSGPSLLRAVLLPLAIAFAVLLALVVLKQLVFAIGRSLRDLGEPEPPRPRHHGSAIDEPVA